MQTGFKSLAMGAKNVNIFQPLSPQKLFNAHKTIGSNVVWFTQGCLFSDCCKNRNGIPLLAIG